MSGNKCIFSFFPFIRLQDVNEAEANFNVARSHSQSFAFVHVAHAQFEHSQGTEMCFAFLFFNLNMKYELWLVIISGVTVSALLSYQATQREAFTYCRVLLNMEPNQRNCWRLRCRECKLGLHHSSVQRIRKMYQVSIFTLHHGIITQGWFTWLT